MFVYSPVQSKDSTWKRVGGKLGRARHVCALFSWLVGCGRGLISCVASHTRHIGIFVASLFLMVLVKTIK